MQKSDEGFEEWTKEEEIRTKSSFVKRGGAKKVTNKQFTYYMCHRSGISIIKSERKRNEKIGGSIKCGKTCSAFMTSIREQQEVIKITVEYQSVHADHEMEVVENVSNKTTLTIDEDSNHLRREKEAILREKEKSVVCEERAELVYEQIRRRTQFINTAASVASTEVKCLDQCLEDLKHMGYSEFGSSLRSIENFPANRYIIKQRQKKNSRLLNKQKLANVMEVETSTASVRTQTSSFGD
ncbi:hypothetical protein TNCV_3067651 [Trichonephila clavipes]|nr:hypothetical protein TNCV_3067651 [Trichonephila clavipes]